MVSSSNMSDEGPRRCWFCSAASSFDPYTRPEDAICPVCGSFGWKVPMLASSIEQAKAAILGRMQIFALRSQTARSLQELGSDLVNTLVYCLAAHGAILWTVQRKSWWRPWSKIKPECRCGQADSSGFARAVLAQNRETLEERGDGANRVLLIGVPWIKDGTTYGVIEVVQRAGSREATKRGYVKFIRQLVGIASQSNVIPK